MQEAVETLLWINKSWYVEFIIYFFVTNELSHVYFLSWLSWEEPVVYGLDSHILVHILKYWTQSLFFFLLEKLEKYIFVILLFYIDLFIILELITILSVNYGNHIYIIDLMTPSGGI